MAREYKTRKKPDNAPVAVAAAETGNRPPHAPELEDADMVLFIHPPALLGLSEGNEDEAELIIEKNRSGETAIIKMTFNGDQVKFTDDAVSLQCYADVISGQATPTVKDFTGHPSVKNRDPFMI